MSYEFNNILHNYDQYIIYTFILEIHKSQDARLKFDILKHLHDALGSRCQLRFH